MNSPCPCTIYYLFGTAYGLVSIAVSITTAFIGVYFIKEEN